MAFGGPRSSCVRPGAHSARHQDSRNDWTPCRMAWPFVSAGAHAPDSDETHGPTPTRGSSHFARRLRSFAFLGSSEALLVTLCKTMAVSQVAQLPGVSDGRVWRTLDHYVDQAHVQEDFSTVTSVGLDETASQRGHNACEGRKARVVAQFADALEVHGTCAENIRAVCMDMSTSCQAGVCEHLPWAAITFDEFHIIQLVNKAVDEVHRQEIKRAPERRRTRYIWLKDKPAWSNRQIAQCTELKSRNPKTHRAFRFQETLRELFHSAQSAAQAESLPDRWYSWARRCRLEPIKAVVKTLKKHWPGASRCVRFQAHQRPCRGGHFAHPGRQSQGPRLRDHQAPDYYPLPCGG